MSMSSACYSGRKEKDVRKLLGYISCRERGEQGRRCTAAYECLR